MEIYRSRPTSVQFRAPFDKNAMYSVEIKSPSHTSTASVRATLHPRINEYFIEIPVGYEHTVYDGVVEFKITAPASTAYAHSEYVDVVTPLFRVEDVPEEYPAKDVPELERLVRKVVEAHTGQSFGRKIERIQATTDQDVIKFDAPLIMLTDLSWGGRHAPLSTTLNPPKIPYEAVDDGWGLVIDWNNYDAKTDSLWVIRNNTPRVATVSGIFGYDRVPQDVKEAALLIAGTWGTKQAVWRDRYIQVMRSADWSVQYHENAFVSTGSATADQLLAKYQRTALPGVI